MFISTNTGKFSHLANNCSQKVTSVPSDCNESKPYKVKLVLLTFIISLFFSTAESRIPLQPFPRLGLGVIYHKQSQSCCLIACVMLYFQMVTLLILFCNRFSKEILQVHRSLFQCCCSSKNILDLVCDMNTFQAQLQRLPFTT